MERRNKEGVCRFSLHDSPPSRLLSDESNVTGSRPASGFQPTTLLFPTVHFGRRLVRHGKGSDVMQSIAETSAFSWVAPRPRLLAPVESTRSAFELVHLADIWRGLLAGEYQLTATHFTESRCLALLQRPSAWPTRRPSPGNVQVLERVLLGTSQKRVAIEIGRSISSVCAAASTGLRELGQPLQPSRVPVLLVLAVHAAHGYERFGGLASAGAGQSILSTERPDLAMSERLTPAERAVARLLVEGHRHAEIATLRQTSPRTIANQLGTIFRKVGVSGRGELLAMLARSH